MRQTELMQAGLNLIQQALSIYDGDLRLKLCNSRFIEMFNLPERYSALGARFDETIRYLAEKGEYGPVEDVDEFVQDRVEMAKAFEPHYVERTRSNGRMLSIEGAPLPLGGWVTVYTDITEIKAQESLLRTRSEVLSEEVLRRSEELAAANRALEATNKALVEARRGLAKMEAQTRLTTEMMPAHLAHADANGIYTYSNKKLSSVMPGRATDIVGMHMRDALGAQSYARVKPGFDKALEGHQNAFEFTDEKSARRIRVVFTPNPSEGGAYILSQDMTEETQARAALQQTKRREIAAQLTSGLGHDFSNLLTIILGMQSKLARMPLNTEAEELVTATMQTVRRGGDLLDHIADITSPRHWNPSAVRLGNFLQDLSVLANSTLPKGITLHVEDQTQRSLLIDSGLLQDALLNLILNAKDALGSAGQIWITAEEQGETWLDVTVQDDGPGFSETAIDHALDPFFSTKGAEGTGLGLAMVYDMAKLAGGSVRLANTDIGARISLRLPLRAAPSTPQTGLAMLVEDNAVLRSQIREMLTAMSFKVIEASSVAEATALAKGLPDIGLILSDLRLEGDAPGTELANSLPHHDIRFMTSLPPTDALFQAAQQTGEVLRKPFDEAQLAQFLRVKDAAE